MIGAQEKIAHLRLLIGDKEGVLKRECFVSSQVPIPKGVLVELIGNRKIEWILRFLKENKEVKLFWFEKKQSIFPTAVHQRGVDLKRIVFANVDEDKLFEASRKAIQSQVFQIVILPSEIEDEKHLRSLHLIAEKSNVTVFLIAKKHRTAWSIGVQLAIDSKGKDFEICIIRHKYMGSS